MSAAYAVVVCPSVHLSVCPSVRPSQEGVLSKRLNGYNWFLAQRLPSAYHTLYHKRIWVSPEIMALPSLDPDHTHYGTVCDRKANTWYILSVYKIWRLSLQPFRRYDCGRRNCKMCHVTRTTPFRGVLSSLTRKRYSLPVCKIWRLQPFQRNVNAHQNLNGTRDQATPLSAMVCHPRVVRVTEGHRK